MTIDPSTIRLLNGLFFVILVVLSSVTVAYLLIAKIMSISQSMHTWPSPMVWVPLTKDFDYEKQFYDVLLPSGVVVKHCWPNAGYLCDINGSGLKFGPEDNIKIRPSPDHPEDAD